MDNVAYVQLVMKVMKDNGKPVRQGDAITHARVIAAGELVTQIKHSMKPEDLIKTLLTTGIAMNTSVTMKCWLDGLHTQFEGDDEQVREYLTLITERYTDDELSKKKD